MDQSAASVLGVERDGAVTILTLNRPDDLNAFDEALHHAFARFWVDLDYDDSARAVVLTGAGRAFSAGASIDAFDPFAPTAAPRPQPVQATKMVLSHDLGRPDVAALGYGLAAETHSHDTPEYAAVPEQFRSRSRG